MGAFVGAVSGYSAAYYAAQAGAAPEREPAGSYYVKEAPGRWFGRGLQALGLVQGADGRDRAGRARPAGRGGGVLRDLRPAAAPGDRRDPRPPPEPPRRRTAPGSPAGRSSSRSCWPPSRTPTPGGCASCAPRRPGRHGRQPSSPTSQWLSPSRISVFHASIRANQHAAERAGDTVAAAYWAGREAVPGRGPPGREPGRAAPRRAVHDDAHGLPRPPGRRPGDRQVGRGGPGRDVLASGHVPSG